jgi:hypothetical protein
MIYFNYHQHSSLVRTQICAFVPHSHGLLGQQTGLTTMVPLASCRRVIIRWKTSVLVGLLANSHGTLEFLNDPTSKEQARDKRGVKG